MANHKLGPASVDVLLHSFLARFFAIPARQPAAEGVTFAQVRVLWILDWKGSATPGAIAGRVGISPSSATELVERLRERGYVLRSHSTRDRRQVVVSLSPSGRRLLKGLSKARQARIKKLSGVLGARDLRRMTAALETLNDIVGRWKDG